MLDFVTTVVFRMLAPLSFRAQRGIWQCSALKTPRCAWGDRQPQHTRQANYNCSTFVYSAATTSRAGAIAPLASASVMRSTQRRALIVAPSIEARKCCRV